MSLQCKSMSFEVTGLRSDVSQFSNSGECNKVVLTNKKKAVNANDFNEKGWNAYKVWKEHPSFECSCVHNLIKKIKEIERRQSVVKEAADPLPQQQKKTRRFLRSLFVCKKMNLVPTIPSGKSHVGYRSANHQFIVWSKKRIFIAIIIYKHLT